MRNDSKISTTTTGKLPPKCDGLQNYNPGDNVILIKDCSDTKSNWRIGEHGVVIQSGSPSTHGQVLVQFRNTHDPFDQVYVYPSSLNILSDSSWISHAKSIRGVRLFRAPHHLPKGLEGLYFEVTGPETSLDRYYYVSENGYIIHREGADFVVYVVFEREAREFQ